MWFQCKWWRRKFSVLAKIYSNTANEILSVWVKRINWTLIDIPVFGVRKPVLARSTFCTKTFEGCLRDNGFTWDSKLLTVRSRDNLVSGAWKRKHLLKMQTITLSSKLATCNSFENGDNTAPRACVLHFVFSRIALHKYDNENNGKLLSFVCAADSIEFI